MTTKEPTHAPTDDPTGTPTPAPTPASTNNPTTDAPTISPLYLSRCDSDESNINIDLIFIIDTSCGLNNDQCDVYATKTSSNLIQKVKIENQ